MNNNYEVKAGLAEIDTFNVVGISIITDNQKGSDDINALWEQFFKEQIGQKVTHKIDDVIYAVYSDYEGDHEAPYRLTIGYRISGGETPETLHRVSVANGEYAIMSAAGEQPQALIETWQAIWSSEDLGRAYQTDFEVYGPRFFVDGVHEVLVHVGVQG